MIKTIVLFIIGLVFLIKGGDWFVDGASGIAKRFNMPAILIGATVVSIGTTLPEVMVSAGSALSGHGEIAYGNAIGSIICNTALISAITIAVYPSLIKRKTLLTPVFFFFVAASFYAAVAYTKHYFSRTTGILLLVIFVIYMVVTVRQAVNDDGAEDEGAEIENEEENGKISVIKEKFGIQIAMLIGGAVLIAVGADLLVDNGTIIAQYYGVPESVIAVTIVALGTSLPELVTAITSLAKGCGALSLGNVIGANLFNLVLVTGVSSTLSPFAVPNTNTINGVPTSLVVEIPVMILVMAFMTIPALIKGELKRYQGIVLLLIYFAFCIFQFA